MVAKFKQKNKYKTPTDIFLEDDEFGSNATRSLISSMEKNRLREYAMYVHQPWKLLGMNFLIGLARGLGSTIGLALVLALIVFIIQQIITLNLPGISSWLAEVIKAIKAQM